MCVSAVMMAKQQRLPADGKIIESGILTGSVIYSVLQSHGILKIEEDKTKWQNVIWRSYSVS